MTTEGLTRYSLGGPTTQGPTRYPIGYWLKRLDRAIDGALDAPRRPGSHPPALADDELSPRGAERRTCAGRGAAALLGSGCDHAG